MSNFGFHWRKRTTFSYCHASNIRVLANLKSDGTTLSSFDYDYDAVGNRTRVVETMEGNSSRTTYSYDDAYQLLREHRTGSQPFDHQNAYDPAGNRLVKDIDGQRTTYAYNEANQIQTAQDLTGFTTFTFDADGNQLVEQAPSGDRTTNAWDFENRRTIVELPSGVRNTATYDPDGLRVALADSTGHKNFIWDEQNVLTETDDTHATQAVYTLEPLTYGRLISQRRGSDSHWHLFNALGTTAQLIDGVQTVTDSCILDAWGVPVSVTGTTINPYRYIGEYGYYYDPDTALYYVRARIYRPMIARWLSVDPILIVAPRIRIQRYLYCNNFPVNGVDPSGALPFNYTLTSCEDLALALMDLVEVDDEYVPGVCVDGNRCRVRISCEQECLAGPVGERGTPACGTTTGNARQGISICISRHARCRPYDIWIIHELEHARQLCRNPDFDAGQAGCDDCLRLEREAYQESCQYAQDEYRPDFNVERCVNCGVWMSCRSFCSAEENPQPRPRCRRSDVGQGVDR